MRETRETGMYQWKHYSRIGVIQARPYVPGESLAAISVSPEDTPAEGGMVCRNPDNPADQWYVNKDYFDRHYHR